jgi:sugar diacid utilization regulator
VNTVQQRLNRIAGKTGMDPRNFRDGVLFWLALRV